MRDHLEAAAKRGHAKARAELAERPLAAHLRVLWECYLSLQRWRGAGGMEASPLTAADLLAFATLYGIDPTPWQADCLKALDLAHLTTMQAD